MGAAVAQLGYLGFEVSDVGAWESFATSVLGLTVARRDNNGALALRLDSHEQRFLISPGKTDDLALLGWQVDDEHSLAELAQRLRAANIDLVEATSEETAARRVTRLVRYLDPNGIPSELFCGPALAAEPFRSTIVTSGFVADQLGLGHLVLYCADRDASVRFYRDLLGFRLSDEIVADVHGYKADIVFFHANRRHHSLALGGPHKKRMHHFMLEARSVDDVGLALDRTLRAGLRIMQTLGRHPNDRMLSFYAKTPSGFQFEFGWGGREVDDATWKPTTYDRISEWGHHPPQFLIPSK